MRRSLFVMLISMVIFGSAAGPSEALQRQPNGDYRARRVALAERMPGGVAILFAATEPVLDFMPYRQDEDFYYLTGWNEPGAAMVLIAASPAWGGAPGAGGGGAA